MGLLNFLNQNENSRKIFGQKEIQIIEKQLLGLNLTQSEKNRLSRDIRKKLEFIRQASSFEEEFSLKKAAEIKRILDQTKAAILADPFSKKITQIILYGPSAQNRFTPHSPLDLAVKFNTFTPSQATSFKKRLSESSSPRITLQVYNHLPKKTKKEINQNGKTLYQKD